MTRKQTQELLNDIRDVLQAECDTRILPKVHRIVIAEHPGNKPLSLEIKVYDDEMLARTYVLSLSERKKARP